MSTAPWRTKSSSSRDPAWLANSAERIDASHRASGSGNRLATFSSSSAGREVTNPTPDDIEYTSGGRLATMSTKIILNIEKNIRYINGAPVLVYMLPHLH
jgi:hypothetical protein